MTVILALLTEEGIVFGSDSREVFNQGGRFLTREHVQKIFPLGNSILYGMSGEVGMTQRVTAELEKVLSGQPGLLNRPIDDLKLRLRNCIFPVIKDASDHTVRVPGWLDPLMHTVVCGWTGGKYWILEIDPRGNVEEHTHRGFCAVGSGGLTNQFAVQCFKHLEINTRRLYQGEAVAYRIIDDVIRSGDPFVGGKVQMFVLTEGGVREINEAELKGIRDSVGVWKEIEKDSLGRLKEPGENS